jgi:SAM-dependent methyltransferase
MSQEKAEPSNSYVIDPESAVEMARLLDQDDMLTRAMGGLLPELSDEVLSTVYKVLDIGCGPGGWGLGVARSYPDVEVFGVDISQKMIQYALSRASGLGLSNAHFQIMNATDPLGFPDASFDLVNARLVSGFLLPHQWSSLAAECLRMLRPGGIVRLTEGEWGVVTVPSSAVARLFALGMDAMYRAGRSFSPDGRYHAITAMLPTFLQEAGFDSVQLKAHVIDHSSGKQAHEGFYEDYQRLFRLGQPFILRQGLSSQEELDALYEQAMAEILSPDFRGLLYLLTACARKPEASS